MRDLVDRTIVLKRIPLCSVICVQVPINDTDIRFIKISKRKAIEIARSVPKGGELSFTMRPGGPDSYVGLIGQVHE